MNGTQRAYPLRKMTLESDTMCMFEVGQPRIQLGKKMQPGRLSIHAYPARQLELVNVFMESTGGRIEECMQFVYVLYAFKLDFGVKYLLAFIRPVSAHQANASYLSFGESKVVPSASDSMPRFYDLDGSQELCEELRRATLSGCAQAPTLACA